MQGDGSDTPTHQLLGRRRSEWRMACCSRSAAYGSPWAWGIAAPPSRGSCTTASGPGSGMPAPPRAVLTLILEQCPRTGCQPPTSTFPLIWCGACSASQHPDLAALPVEFLANGWDNALFRLGSELVVRMPRRQLGATIIEHEQRWLPSLAPRLPLPVPYPERTGHSALGYPYSWSVVPYIPGRPRPANQPGRTLTGGRRGYRRRVP